MAKVKDGKYIPGKRSDLWLKVKVLNTIDCVIIGYNQGNGDHKNTFGRLHIGEQ